MAWTSDGGANFSNFLFNWEELGIGEGAKSRQVAWALSQGFFFFLL